MEFTDKQFYYYASLLINFKFGGGKGMGKYVALPNTSSNMDVVPRKITDKWDSTLAWKTIDISLIFKSE